MKFKVLVSAPYLQHDLEGFLSEFESNQIKLVVPKVRERLSEEELLALVGDIDGVIAGDDAFTEKVLSSAPKLKVLSKWGTGIDSFDQDAAKRFGIAIRNTPGAFTEPVADQIIGYMLSFARRIPWIDAEMKKGIWSKQTCVSLSGMTLGVIGVGRIGREVLKRARGFGMKLLGNDIIDIPNSVIQAIGVTMCDKNTLLEQSDYVSLACDLNHTSRHIMGQREFALMKRSAVLINTARGPLVDEPALIRALVEKRIAGVALDVFEDEPLPETSPLRNMENTLLSPHNSNSSPAHWRRVHRSTIDNLLEVLKSTAPSQDVGKGKPIATHTKGQK
jgi:D-3-phosphoglycerate dehydrogenase